MRDSIAEAVAGVQDELIRVRRYFHQHPETAWKETETQKAILSYLEGLGLTCEVCAGTGVIAEIKGNQSSDHILGIRADIDALPVPEETGFPFASVNEGVSHACGHDTHIAMALLTAKILTGMKDELPVTVRMLFQPAEETPGNCGGAVMKDVPSVKQCGRMVAIHTWSKIPAGKAGLSEGPVMASADTFEVLIEGKGGHGAVPQEAIDPIPAAADFIQAVQRIVSRRTDPFQAVVVTIGSVHAGTTWNVIPDTAELMGTVRTYDSEIAGAVPHMLDEIAEGISAATGTKITVTYHTGPRPVFNDPEAVRTARKAASDVFGAENIIDWRQMVAEDFACYEAPKCLLFLGGGLPEEEKRWPQHSPHYTIDENVLMKGVEYFVRYVFIYGSEVNGPGGSV